MTVKSRLAFPLGPFEAVFRSLWACQRGPKRSPKGNFHFVKWTHLKNKGEKGKKGKRLGDHLMEAYAFHAIDASMLYGRYNALHIMPEGASCRRVVRKKRNV